MCHLAGPPVFYFQNPKENLEGSGREKESFQQWGEGGAAQFLQQRVRALLWAGLGAHPKRGGCVSTCLAKASRAMCTLQEARSHFLL